MQIRSNLFKRFDLSLTRSDKKAQPKMLKTPEYKGLTIEIGFQKGLRRIIPEIATQSWVISNLRIPKASLFRYRQIASLHIPAYEKASERLWLIKYGEPWINTQSRRLNKGKCVQGLDKPPFCKLQILILLSVREMFKEMNESQIIAQLVNNPLYWRKFTNV